MARSLSSVIVANKLRFNDPLAITSSQQMNDIFHFGNTKTINFINHEHTFCPHGGGSPPPPPPPPPP